MNRVWIRFIVVLTAFLFVLAACSNDDNAKNKKDQSEETAKSEEKVTIPDAATEPEEMVKEGPGKVFTVEEMDPQKLKEAIETLPKDLTADKAYNHLIHLFAADYSSPLKEYEKFNPSFLVDGAPTNDDEQQEEPKEEKKLHVALLLDASGSMGAAVNGEIKMKAAKDSLKQFVSDLPTDTKILLRVYGHKGTGSDEDKKMSCNSTEVVYPLSTYDEKTFNKSLSKFKPAGWTPLAASIKAAKKDLQGNTGDNVKNVVYIISDGEETCGGDPVQAAKQLHESGIATEVNIIGFNVGNEAQAQLKKVAEAGGGTFTNVDSGKDLVDIAGDQIEEALDAAEMNMWSAMEGVDLTWDAIHMNDELDAIAANFRDIVDKENSLLLNGLEGLEQTKKVTEKVAEEVRNLIEEREEKLDQFNENKEDALEQKIEEEKQKASDLIDQIRENRAKE